MVHSTSNAVPAAVPLSFCYSVVAVLPAGHVVEECEHGGLRGHSVEHLRGDDRGECRRVGVCRWCTCCGHTYHVSGGVRSSGFLPRKSWLHPASVSRKRLSVRSIGAFSFSVHVGVPSLRVQWNSRPWYSVSAWILRRFDRFFFGFFPPSARCFLFGLVDPYPAGVILALGTMFGIQKKKRRAVAILRCLSISFAILRIASSRLYCKLTAL